MARGLHGHRSMDPSGVPAGFRTRPAVISDRSGWPVKRALLGEPRRVHVAGVGPSHG